MAGHHDSESTAGRVRRAMAQTARADFLPVGVRHFAEQDRALQIGHGATCSQPSTLRAMLELLRVEAGHRVLDVGSGSGWSTAILARLVGPTGTVLGVDLEEPLVQRSARIVDRMPNASVRVALPGVLGAPEQAPFDRILVSAATDRVPEPLVDQLCEDGAMVLPLAGRLVRITRGGRETAPGYYQFVPLR